MRPGPRLVQNRRPQRHWNESFPVVHASVPLLPKRPSDQPDEGVKTLSPHLCDMLPHGAPPFGKPHRPIRRQPLEEDMP
jgi:hypothetical protein